MFLHYHNDNLYVYEVFVFKFLSCKFIRPLKKREKKIERPEGLPGLVHAFVCELCCILIVLDKIILFIVNIFLMTNQTSNPEFIGKS